MQDAKIAAESAADEVLRLQSAADAHLAEVSETCKDMVHAGAALDDALRVAREAAEAFDHAAQVHAVARRKAAEHDRVVEAAARTNAILAGRHRSLHPRTRVKAADNPPGLRVEIARYVPWNCGAREAIESAEVFARDRASTSPDGLPR